MDGSIVLRMHQADRLWSPVVLAFQLTLYCVPGEDAEHHEATVTSRETSVVAHQLLSCMTKYVPCIIMISQTFYFIFKFFFCCSCFPEQIILKQRLH